TEPLREPRRVGNHAKPHTGRTEPGPGAADPDIAGRSEVDPGPNAEPLDRRHRRDWAILDGTEDLGVVGQDIVDAGEGQSSVGIPLEIGAGAKRLVAGADKQHDTYDIVLKVGAGDCRCHLRPYRHRDDVMRRIVDFDDQDLVEDLRSESPSHLTTPSALSF